MKIYLSLVFVAIATTQSSVILADTENSAEGVPQQEGIQESEELESVPEDTQEQPEALEEAPDIAGTTDIVMPGESANLLISVVNQSDALLTVAVVARGSDTEHRWLALQNRVPEESQMILGSLSAPADITFDLVESKVVLLSEVGDSYDVPCILASSDQNNNPEPEDDEGEDVNNEEPSDFSEEDESTTNEEQQISDEHGLEASIAAPGSLDQEPSEDESSIDGQEESSHDEQENLAEDYDPEASEGEQPSASMSNDEPTEPEPDDADDQQEEPTESASIATAKKSIDFYIFKQEGQDFPRCLIYLDAF